MTISYQNNIQCTNYKVIIVTKIHHNEYIKPTGECM